MKQGRPGSWVYLGKQDLQKTQSTVNAHLCEPFCFKGYFCLQENVNCCGIFQPSISQNENSSSATKCIPSIPFLEGVLCTNTCSLWTHWSGEW